MDFRQQIAMHEAGHVIAAIDAGHVVRYAKLLSPSSEVCHAGDPQHREFIALAGWMISGLRGQDDDAVLERYQQSLPAENREPWLQGLVDFTREWALQDGTVPAAFRVAAALSNRGSLTGDEIRDMLGVEMPKRFPQFAWQLQASRPVAEVTPYTLVGPPRRVFIDQLPSRPGRYAGTAGTLFRR